MMESASSGGLSTVLIIMILILSAVPVYIMIGFIKGMKRKKLKAEAEKMKAEAEKLRKEQLSRREKEKRELQEKKQAEQEEHEQKLLLARKETAKHFFALPDNDGWDVNIIHFPDQQKSMDLAYCDADEMELAAYDLRYNLAKIRGTSFRFYLTNAMQCSCQDFRFDGLPCKHMYYLGNKLHELGVFFHGMDDCHAGLSGYTACLLGRFPGGKDTAAAFLRDRGCIVVPEYDSSVSFAVTGRTHSKKAIEKLADGRVPMIDYNTALKLFS